MKKYILPSLGGLAIIAGAVVMTPLSAAAEGYVPVDPCTQNCSAQTTVVPDGDPAPQAGLADTGSSIPIGLMGAGGAAVILGVSIVVVRRRSRTSH